MNGEIPEFSTGDVLNAEDMNKIVRRLNELHSIAPRTDEPARRVIASPLFQTRQLAPDDKLVFTLMPFTEPWSNYIWTEEIRPIVEGLKQYKLRCLRADDIYGNDVMRDVYEHILRARIVIADITGKNPNVFYELGIAHTLGKDVILLAQGTQHIPFDLLRFRHCIYSNDGPGYKALRSYIPEAISTILAE